MFNRKELKQKGKRALRLNYLACVAVCFLMVFIAGEYSTTIQAIALWDKTHVADLKYTPAQKQEIILDMVDNNLSVEQTSKKWHVNNLTAVRKWRKSYDEFGIDGLNSKEVTFFNTTGDNSNIQSLLNAFSITRTAQERLDSYINDDFEEKIIDSSVTYIDGLTRSKSYKFTFISSIVSVFSENKTLWDTFVVIGNFIFSLIVAIFITNLTVVCERRFYIENRIYHKTKVGRMGFLFRERTLHPIKTMFVRDVLLTLWGFTIAGYIIKRYSYAMVPYILAENPNIKTKKAITLSREMMNGYKWELFKLDLSMSGWVILSMASLGLIGLLFTNPYKAAVGAEVYIKLRREAIEKNYLYSEELDDKFLDLDLLDEQSRRTAQGDEEPKYPIIFPEECLDSIREEVRV